MHGEPDPARALTEKLDEAGIGRVHYPELGSAVNI